MNNFQTDRNQIEENSEFNRVRPLGNSGISVSAIGLGCWAIGGPFTLGGRPDGWGDVDDAVSERAILTALDNGVTLFDTADVYGTGHSERVLGKALKRQGRRHEAIIATKVGYTYDEAQKTVTGTNLEPEYIERALVRSLGRLETDYVDLYQIHVGDADPGVIGEAGAALERFAEKGLIRAWGWSTDSTDNIETLPDFPHLAAVQHTLNLFEGNTGLLEVARQRGLASLNRSPLAMGLLTGKFSERSQLPADDVRGAGHAWVSYFHNGKPDANMLVKLEAIRELLQTGGRSLAQGALSWLLARSNITVPIPGFKNEAQARENAGAIALSPLPGDIMSEIDVLLEYQ